MIYITKICQSTTYTLWKQSSVIDGSDSFYRKSGDALILIVFPSRLYWLVYKITCIYIHNQAVFAWPVVPSAPHSCLLFSKKRPTRNSIGNPAYASSAHMNQCIYELWLYESSTFALHFTTTKFLSNHCVKKVLGTYIDDWFTVSILVFYRKTFLQNVDLSKKNFLTKCGS
jgi:hypothetical protein